MAVISDFSGRHPRENRDPGLYFNTYILTNRRNGTVYTGVTSDLDKRVASDVE